MSRERRGVDMSVLTSSGSRRKRCVAGQAANLSEMTGRLATCPTSRESSCSRTAGVPAALRAWRPWAVLLLLAGYLLFCHGCHGDEDNELFTAFDEVDVTGRR